ncbi:HlyD family secretion protein [Neolewinella persica]|uniref:HlyD family secretion protein n=1 Tax=Neolewinella persica TaxID=70998 RepID=UPI00036795D0|nr:HlyD family efflux transporter periplasmic adaptor subunit [Neolewinella persica]
MKYSSLLFILFALSACTESVPLADAYGNFEATSTTVSAEANGRLLYLSVAEGEVLPSGKLIGLVDTTQLYLQRRQLEAQLSTFGKQVKTAAPDIAILEDQKRNLIRERDRTKRLVAAKAATSRQLDELNGQIEVVDQQIAAAQMKISEVNRGILSGKDPIRAQIEVIDHQISKAYIYNPIRGTVMTKLAETSEIVGMGSPLYRIANIDTLTLRAYAGSVQLQRAGIGQKVDVLIDAGADAYDQLSGTVTWISDRAEFTPKTIQTKEERTNLVYAIKIAVPNPDGRLKLGMPAEVNFGGADAGAITKTEGQ